MAFKILSAILAIFLTISLVLSNNYKKDRDKLQNQIENDFKVKYKNLERELYDTQIQRDSLRKYFLKIDSLNSILRSQIKSTNQELTKIKGKYDKLNSSELSQKMIEEFHAR